MLYNENDVNVDGGKANKTWPGNPDCSGCTIYQSGLKQLPVLPYWSLTRH